MTTFMTSKIPLSKALENTKNFQIGDLKRIQYDTNKHTYIYNLEEKTYIKIEKATDERNTLEFDIIRWLKLFLNQYFKKLSDLDEEQNPPEELMVPAQYEYLIRYCQILFQDQDQKNKQDENGNTFLMSWFKQCEYPIIYEHLPDFVFNNPDIQNNQGQTLEMIIIQHGIKYSTFRNYQIKEQFILKIRPSDPTIKDKHNRSIHEVLYDPEDIKDFSASCEFLNILLLKNPSRHEFLKGRIISNVLMVHIQYWNTHKFIIDRNVEEYSGWEKQFYQYWYAKIMAKLYPFILEENLDDVNWEE